MKKIIIILAAMAAIGTALISCSTVPVNQASQSGASGTAVAPTSEKHAVTKQVAIQIPCLVREEISLPDGRLSQLTVYTYDAAGHKVKEELFNQKKQLVFRKTYETSVDGLNQTITTTNPANEVQGRVVRQLDPQGHLLNETLFNEQKEVVSASEYTWDKAGNPVTWVSRNRDKSIVITTVYKMSNGRVVSIELNDDKGVLIKRFDQTWNDQGLLIKKNESDPVSGPIGGTSYRYTDKLLAGEVTTKADGTIIRSLGYTYNEQQLPVQVQYFDRQGKVTESHKQDFQVFQHNETITVYE